jgi:hypothetical protein
MVIGIRPPARSLRALIATAAAAGVIALALAACGSGGHEPTRTVVSAGASLPLQKSVPPVGGDAQPAVHDVLRRAITPKQQNRLVAACGGGQELSSSVECMSVEEEVLGNGRPCDATAQVCIVVLGGGDPRDPGILQLYPSGRGTSKCSSASRVCLQLPLTSRVMSEVARIGGAGPSTLPSTGPSATGGSPAPPSGGSPAPSSGGQNSVATPTAPAPTLATS